MRVFFDLCFTNNTTANTGTTHLSCRQLCDKWPSFSDFNGHSTRHNVTRCEVLCSRRISLHETFSLAIDQIATLTPHTFRYQASRSINTYKDTATVSNWLLVFKHNSRLKSDISLRGMFHNVDFKDWNLVLNWHGKSTGTSMASTEIANVYFNIEKSTGVNVLSKMPPHCGIWLVNFNHWNQQRGKCSVNFKQDFKDFNLWNRHSGTPLLASVQTMWCVSHGMMIRTCRFVIKLTGLTPGCSNASSTRGIFGLAQLAATLVRSTKLLYAGPG